MNMDKLQQALVIWQQGPKLKTDYHSSTGLLSNSFIGDFIKCEYDAIISYAIKEPQPFNETFGIGHVTEALIFEGDKGLKKQIDYYGHAAIQPPTKKALELFVDHTNAIDYNLDPDYVLPNGKKPTKTQVTKLIRVLSECGTQYPIPPQSTERPWVKKSRELAKSVTRHKNLVDLFRSEGSIYHQVITFDLHGMDWRGEIDYLNLNKGTEIDLKTTKGINDKSWNDVNKQHDMTFIDNWNYHRQRALYQVGIYQQYGEMVTPRILAIDKGTSSVRMFKFDDQKRLEHEIRSLEPIVSRIKEVIAGESVPDKCGSCAQCIECEKVDFEISTKEFCAYWG